MSEENKNPQGNYEDKSIEKCANMMTSSMYKMQLALNSIRDEIRTLVEVQTAILEEQTKKASELQKNIEKQ